LEFPGHRHRYFALIAIRLHEPERDTFFDRIADAEVRKVSAVCP
jgi:hypothetical protein